MRQNNILNVLNKKYDSAMNLTSGNKGVKKISRFIISISRAVFLFSLCLVLLYPIFIMLSVALRNANELYDPTVIWIPKTITFDAFIAVYKYLDFLMIALKTLKISVIGTALQLAACIMAGYGFARHNFPFKKLLFGILILSIIVPTQVITIPSMVYFQNFDFFGIGSLIGLFTGKALTITLMNNELAYYLPAILGSGIKSGLFIFILIQFFRGLPYELSDAAYIDGCGRFRTFLQIMLPLAGGAILTVLLFSLVWYWNDSLFSVIFFDNLRTVSTVLQNVRNELIAAQNNKSELAQIPQMQAAALMSIAPLLVMYIALQKYFTESIERTGIVG